MKRENKNIKSTNYLFIRLIALNIVFGSLYLDEVTLDPKTVVSVLAAAALLQLDGLIEKCCEVMNSTINAEVCKIASSFIESNILSSGRVFRSYQYNP